MLLGEGVGRRGEPAQLLGLVGDELLAPPGHVLDGLALPDRAAEVAFELGDPLEAFRGDALDAGPLVAVAEDAGEAGGAPPAELVGRVRPHPPAPHDLPDLLLLPLEDRPPVAGRA